MAIAPIILVQKDFLLNIYILRQIVLKNIPQSS